MAKDKKAAVAEWKAAKRDLDAIADRDRRAGNRDETPEYLAANDRADKAFRELPWWRR